MKYNEVALIYDFDGTLTHGNIQEYNFIPALKMTSNSFWDEVDKLRIENSMENVLAYMYLMIKKANENNVSVTKSSFARFGENIELYPGVNDWFDRINQYGKSLGLNIHHYIISSSIKEMIEGTSIKDKFDKIYACSFLYNEADIAIWPAVSINYTNKTQFLFRINKGIYEVYDADVNKKMSDDEKVIPFSNMIYFGDGMTDVPCMKLVKDRGGASISIYESKRKKDLSNALQEQGRVTYVAEADYSENKNLDKYVKSVLKEISKRIDK